MTPDELLIAAYTSLLEDPRASSTARARAADGLRAMVALERHHEADVDPDAPLLTVAKRAALRDAITWGFDPGLWDEEQRAVVVELALWSRAELDDEIEAARPRRRRAR